MNTAAWAAKTTCVLRTKVVLMDVRKGIFAKLIVWDHSVDFVSTPVKRVQMITVA